MLKFYVYSWSKREEKRSRFPGVLERRFYGVEVSKYIQEMLPCFLELPKIFLSGNFLSYIFGNLLGFGTFYFKIAHFCMWFMKKNAPAYTWQSWSHGQ
jgi:hypothetical protein